MIRFLKFFLPACLLSLLLLPVCAMAAPWLPFGPDGGDARRFASDPQDHTHLYLGTANGWIYESHDSGASWRRLSMLGKRDDLILDSIVVDPADSKHVVVGAYSVDKPDGGLYITYDGGVSWISQAEMRGQSIRSLSVAPSDPKIWVAGTLKGVFRSTDGARRWTLISPLDSTEIHEVESVAIDPVDPSVIYAGTWHLPWKTTDGGANWSNMKNGIIDDSDVFSIIIDPKAANIVYASACSGIYKSTDAGGIFAKVQGIPNVARRTRVLMQDPGHRATVFAGTTEGLFRTDDAGKVWTRTTGPGIIVNDVYIDAGDSQHVLIATDRGGVLASDDGGNTFRSSNSGFSARQITSLTRDASHPATLFVGVVNDKEWGGVFESDNGGVNWMQRSDGLGGRDIFALGQAPDGTIVAGTSHGFYRLDKTAETWTRVEDTPRPTVKEVAAAQVTPPVVTTRPPVAIGRNQYAKAQGARGHRTPVPSSLKGSSRTVGGVPKASRSTGLKGKLAAKSSTGRSNIPSRGTSKAQPLHSVATHKATASTAPLRVAVKPVTPPAPPSFDGSVFSLTTTGDGMLATTTEGLLSSKDNGTSWQTAGPGNTQEWRSLASAQDKVIAATLSEIFYSPDAGASWSRIPLPEGLTRVSAIAVEPGGEIWVGGREGVFVSADLGVSWVTPKNLFLNSVNSLNFDAPANRILVTSAGPSDLVFTVQLPAKTVTYTRSGWDMRFVRPVGDHLVAVTPYDGLIIQPKMVAAPVKATAAVVRPPAAQE